MKLDRFHSILATIQYFNPNLYGRGKFAPQAVFCYSSKTVGIRLLKICGFYSFIFLARWDYMAA